MGYVKGQTTTLLSDSYIKLFNGLCKGVNHHTLSDSYIKLFNGLCKGGKPTHFYQIHILNYLMGCVKG